MREIYVVVKGEGMEGRKKKKYGQACYGNHTRKFVFCSQDLTATEKLSRQEEIESYSLSGSSFQTS